MSRGGGIWSATQARRNPGAPGRSARKTRPCTGRLQSLARRVQGLARISRPAGRLGTWGGSRRDAESLARPNDRRTLGRKLESSPVEVRVSPGVLACKELFVPTGTHEMKRGARRRYQVEKLSWGQLMAAEHG
ncbi:hypothetical protein F2P79_009201 [Pimephales promelas]|nr:hypothetical protein F2P79_009201 [Pimephales promelas]